MNIPSSPDGSTVEASFRETASIAQRCYLWPERVGTQSLCDTFQYEISKLITRLLVLGMFVVFTGTTNRCQAEIRPDFLMDSDPEMNIPDPVKHFSPALKSLWLAALERPENDMQRLAAETIARGHEFGVPDLTEAVPRLQTLLLAEKSHPATRFAAARALIVLEARESSDKLFEVSQKYEADLRQLIEPALAKWNFAPAIEVWKGRLGNPEARPRDLILAFRGLAQVRDSSVASALMAIVRDGTRNADLRLEAAVAAGQCATSGLEPEAARLAQNKSKQQSIYAIAACRLLARHDSEDARKILTELASRQESVVAASALNRLLEIDSSLVLPLAEVAMNHADPNVRRAGASAYLQQPTEERISFLARLLADPHPGVRKEISDGLYHLSSQAPLVEAIHASAMDVLSQEAWQGQEQAALLLGSLEHQPAAGRLAELLDSPRAEVGISTAWALRKIASEESIPAIIDKVGRQTERRKQVSDPMIDVQVTHLCEALGVLKAEGAIPLLKQYVPKSSVLGERSRCAAILAIGLIKEGQRDADLENAFSDRINDFSDTKPESDLIKEKCAISLARMKAVDYATEMKGLFQANRLAFRQMMVFRWAVKELTGEVLPPIQTPHLHPGNWFLEPFAR